MVEYENIGTFGEVHFGLSDIKSTEISSTLKTNLGKTLIQKSIPLRNTKDTVLRITGIIQGLSQTSAQTISQALEIDRTALNDLNDGYFHTYSDGRHSGNYVIEPNSLSWQDNANRTSGQPYRFTMNLISW